MHVNTPLKVHYYGTPVVLVSTRDVEGRANLSPMSSAWWLGGSAMLGIGNKSQTAKNLREQGECVLNLAPSDLAESVDRLADLTAVDPVPPTKAAKGYRHEADKFGAAGLTEQAAELVAPPRVLECPVQLECRVVDSHPFNATCTAFEVEVLRSHVDERMLVPGTAYVDPDAWDPLIMKFCEYYGEGRHLRPSRLAANWRMPHQHLAAQ
ncbi:flavin reductase family protein [Glycomyces sp. NPDC046736]|uniref:flavin reductase family protein n=1 Tax=Glycomyces sp. NPDC046736 TaxID=3155615 RepID=UPI0033E112C2